MFVKGKIVLLRMSFDDVDIFGLQKLFVPISLKTVKLISI